MTLLCKLKRVIPVAVCVDERGASGNRALLRSRVRAGHARFRGGGKHLLILSFSQFDPTATSARSIIPPRRVQKAPAMPGLEFELPGFRENQYLPTTGPPQLKR